MPPNQPRLSNRVIADLTEWVRKGAPDPRDQNVKPLDENVAWAAEFRSRLDWWSLQAAVRIAPPIVESNSWSDKPIDRFILSALRQRQ